MTVKPDKGDYLRAAATLDANEANVRVMVSRMRHRYRDLLVAHIAQTVSSDEEVDAELQYLFSTFSSQGR